MSPNGWAATRRSNSPGHEALVFGLIAEVPDATLDELVARLRKAPVSARHPSPQGKGHDQPHRPVAVSGQSQPQL